MFIIVKNKKIIFKLAETDKKDFEIKANAIEVHLDSDLKKGYKNFIFDFEEVKNNPSSDMIGLLVKAKKMVNVENGRIELSNMNSNFENILDQVGVLEFLYNGNKSKKI